MTTITLDFKAAVDDAVGNIKRLNAQFDVMGKLNRDAGGALKTFGVDLNALNSPITLLATGFKAAITETVKWAGDIDKLSRNTGLTTEAASKLAIVAGDVGIELGTLESALKQMTKQGLDLSIDSLKKLSVEYNALPPGVERLKFATEKFGRAAQDMTEILSRTPEELDALGQAAVRSGRVMSAEGVANAEKFEQSLAQLQDTSKGLAVTVGNVAIPALLNAGKAFTDLQKTAAVLNVVMQENTGIIDHNQAVLRTQAIVAGDLTAAYEQQYEAIDDTTDAHERAAAAALYVSEASKQLTANYQAFDVAAYGASRAAYEVAAAERDAAAAAEGANKIYIDAKTALEQSNIPLNEKLDLLNELAIATGQTTAEELENKEAIGFLTKQLELGKISLDEWKASMDDLALGAANANGVIQAVLASLGNFPPHVGTTIDITENFNGAGNTGASPYSGGTTNDEPVYGGAQASGGDYMVTKPTWFLAGEAGPERATFTPQGSTTNMGGITINVSGAGDPRAVAAEVSRILAAQARGGRSAGYAAIGQ